MSDSPKPSKWIHQAVAAAAVVLVVAISARVAWALLAPLVPGLVAALGLIALFAIVFGKFRK
jgi:membrane protein YdbS with pleckstrin-like domain